MLLIIGIFLMLILPLTLFYGHYRFYSAVEKEVNTMFNSNGNSETLVTNSDLEALPKKLSEYLRRVGVLNACKDCSVTFTQTGRIKTRQDKNWTDFTATQYMTAISPNFIWSARTFPLFIRDKSTNGQGEVKVSLFGIKDIIKTEGKKTDKSALARGLGELLFYPVGFLSEAISWEVMANGSLKAKAKVDETEVEGIYHFNEEGLLYIFESKRYMDENLENFTGIVEDHTTMSGLLVPSKMRAIWNLKDGDFEYFNCTITKYRID